MNLKIKESLQNGIPYVQNLSNFVDDRGWSLMNLFANSLGGGQINVSSMHPGVVKAWHMHKVQIDCWVVVRGTLKCAVYSPEHTMHWSWVVGERNPSIIYIPSNCWHGCATVGSEIATLLYYVTETYNTKSPDEIRKSPQDHVVESWDGCENFVWESVNK
jgi:dTDP-4-dehydrorhamnose 3,5-epimerase